MTRSCEIAPTIGLLSRVPPERAESLLDPPSDDGPDESRRGDVIALGVRQSRRRRTAWWSGGIAAAAAIIVAVVLAVTLAIAPAVRNVQVVALDPVADLPLTATVELTDVAWGTRIEMICRYTDSPDPDEPATGRRLLIGHRREGRHDERGLELAGVPRRDGTLGRGYGAGPRSDRGDRDPLGQDRASADAVRARGLGVTLGYAPRLLPCEPSCWVASTTRTAMADSATLPHARGS